VAPLTLDRTAVQTGVAVADTELSTRAAVAVRQRSTTQRPDDAPDPRKSDARTPGRPETSVGLVDALNGSASRSRKGSSALDEALVALRDVAAGNGAAPHALETARLLKRAALERKHSAPRTASVALVVSDALTFTNLADLAEPARQPLHKAVETLVKPFISTDDECDLMKSLLANRWYVTPAFNGAAILAAAEGQAQQHR
jgi:hypothetical protein